jgi:Na+/H+ antiporter NhaD/arsenite permease-like protein
MTGLGFWRYVAIAAPVAIASLVIIYAVVAWTWRGEFAAAHAAAMPHTEPRKPLYSDRRQFHKALLATAVLLILFATPVPREIATLAVAGVLIASRRIESRQLVGAVDWGLLILFAALFVVTGAFLGVVEGEAGRGGIAAQLAATGWLPDRLTILAPLALAMSNTIGNVPSVILILQAWPSPPEGAMTALAIVSTLAGNLFLVGSLANLIVAERAQAAGVRLAFAAHARAGVPITLISVAIAAGWLAALGVLPL